MERKNGGMMYKNFSSKAKEPQRKPDCGLLSSESLPTRGDHGKCEEQPLHSVELAQNYEFERWKHLFNSATQNSPAEEIMSFDRQSDVLATTVV